MVMIGIIDDMELQFMQVEVMAVALSRLKERIGLDVELVRHPDAPDWLKAAVDASARRGIVVLPFRFRGDGEMVMLLGAGVTVHGAFKPDGTDLSEAEGQVIIASLRARLGRVAGAAGHPVPGAKGEN